MPQTKFGHVDAWLDAPTADERELPAKMWLEKFRAPAGRKDEAWLKAHILRCQFQERTYVVVGCSRMGDVWLAQGRANAKEIPESYELRVSIDDCSGWSMQLTSTDYIDIDGPWRISSDIDVCKMTSPMIVDCCNRMLFTIHKGGHPLTRLNVSAAVMERIVKDHNDALVPFVSPYASELDTSDEEVPADATCTTTPTPTAASPIRITRTPLT